MYNFLAFCDAVLCVFQTVNYLSKEERGSYFASAIIGQARIQNVMSEGVQICYSIQRVK